MPLCSFVTPASKKRPAYTFKSRYCDRCILSADSDCTHDLTRREGNAIGPGLPLEFLLLLCFLRRFFSLFPFQYVKDRGGGAVTTRGTEAAESGVGAPCVENNGFEPLTPCVQSRCSSQLS